MTENDAQELTNEAAVSAQDKNADDDEQGAQDKNANDGAQSAQDENANEGAQGERDEHRRRRTRRSRL